MPDLCADRLDYFLRDSVCYKEITPQEALGILKSLELLNNRLIVSDPEIGAFIMKHSALMTVKHWGPPWGCFMFDRTAAAMRRSLELSVITEADYEYHLTSKFRMIDPPVKAAGAIKRASELYPALAESLAAEKEKFKRGYFIRVIR